MPRLSAGVGGLTVLLAARPVPGHRSETDHLVVVGASLAGLRAAEAARAEGWQGRLTLIGAEQHLPYDRPPLSKAALDPGGAAGAPFRSADDFERVLGIEVLLGTPVDGLDAASRTLSMAGRTLRYDALVIATGSTPIRLPGSENLGGVTVLRTPEDAATVREALDNEARTVVIGAGFIGAEVATAARRRGLSVTIVERLGTSLVRALGPIMGEVCANLHRAAGVDLRLGVSVEGLRSEGGRVTAVVLDDGSVVAADLVVVGIGARPTTSWLEDSGIALHPRDRGILCDATLATSLPGVWAAGDVAHVPHPLVDDEPLRIEHWTNASEQGALAGRNAVCADPVQALETVPYFWSDWHGHRLQFVGVPAADEVARFGPDGPGALALYRRGQHLVGAFGIDRRREVTRLRRLISGRAGWSEAVALVDPAPTTRQAPLLPGPKP